MRHRKTIAVRDRPDAYRSRGSHNDYSMVPAAHGKWGRTTVITAAQCDAIKETVKAFQGKGSAHAHAAKVHGVARAMVVNVMARKVQRDIPPRAGLSDSVIATIQTMAHAGHHPDDIAVAVGASTCSVRLHWPEGVVRLARKRCEKKDHELATVERLLREGCSRRQIAEEMGITLRQVGERARHLPKDVPKGFLSHGAPGAKRREMLRLLATGHSRREISDLLGLNYWHVAAEVRRAKAELPPDAPRPVNQWGGTGTRAAKMLRLFEAGHTRREIAEMLGLTRSHTARAILQARRTAREGQQ